MLVQGWAPLPVLLPLMVVGELGVGGLGGAAMNGRVVPAALAGGEVPAAAVAGGEVPAAVGGCGVASGSGREGASF